MPRGKRKRSKNSNRASQGTNARVPISATVYRGPLLLTSPLKNADNDTIMRTILDVILVTVPTGGAGAIFNGPTIDSFPNAGGPDWVKLVSMYNGFRTLSQKICWCPYRTVNGGGGLPGSQSGMLVAQPARNPIVPTFTVLGDIDYSCFLRQLAGDMGEVLQYKMTGTLESEFQDTASPASNWVSLISIVYGDVVTAVYDAGVILVYTTVQFRGAS